MADSSVTTQSNGDRYLFQVIAPEGPRDGCEGDIAARTGDVCIFDAALSPALAIASRRSMMLPMQLLEDMPGSRHLHGVVLDAALPMTTLVAACIEALCALDKPLPKQEAIAAQDALVTLLLAALRERGSNEGITSRHPSLRQCVLEFMDRNLYLQDLSPELICRRLSVSRAHLYRAFASDGGVAKVLRDMRLDAVHCELTQGIQERSITEIAHSLGFSSANQLLRSFRTRFGVTPSEARTAIRRGEIQENAHPVSQLTSQRDCGPVPALSSGPARTS